MISIADLFEQIAKILSTPLRLAEVNHEYRKGIRTTVEKLADDLNDWLLQVEVSVGRGRAYEGEDRRRYFSEMPEKLAGQTSPFEVCSGLRDLQDRLRPGRLDPLKLGIEIGQLEAVCGLLEELGENRRAVFLELDDLWPRLQADLSTVDIDTIQLQLRERRRAVSDAASKLIEVM